MVAISSVIPIVNTASAALNSNITINFDAAINTATVNLSTVKIQGTISGQLSGTFSFKNNNKTVVFDPGKNFQPGEEIQVTVTSGVKDTLGTTANKYVYAFRAGVNYFSSGIFTESQVIQYQASDKSDPKYTAATTSNSDAILADFDGDGNLDALVGHGGYGGPNPALQIFDPINRVLLGNGQGQFAPKADGILIDQDGSGNFYLDPSTGKVVAPGTAGTIPIPVAAFRGLTTSELFGGDFDGDGDIDVFISNFGSEGVYLNNGGQFTLSQVLTGPIDPGKFSGLLQGDVSSGVDIGDIDGDGDMDAAVSNIGTTQIYINDGNGIFTNSGQNLLPRSHTAGVDLGDLDGDGDLDMVLGSLANIYDTPDFFIGAVGGTPTLADPNNPDFDSQGFNTVWKNDGSGNFTLWQSIEPNVRSAVMKLGDVDGDGDLDALSANLGPGLLSGEESERTSPYGFAPNYSNRNLPGGNQLWINDGTGTFTQGQLIGNDITNGVEFADFDGDGDLDIWEANFGTAYGLAGTADRIWLNDGSGNFTDSGQLFPNGVSANVAFGDINGDGALDAFVANFAYTEPSRVYLNSIDSSKPEAAVNASTNVVSVSKSTNLKFKLTKINTSVVNEVGFFVVRDNNGTITDSNGQSLTPADAGYTAAAMQQATVLFSALGNSPSGFDPLSLDRIIGALGGTADVFAGGAKLVFYFLEEGSTDGLVAGKSGNVLFGTTFASSAFGASANLTITDLGGGKFSLSWLDNLTLTLESTDDDLPFGSSLQGQNECEILDLTGLSGSINISVNVYREAAFDNLVGFYVIDDIEGTVAGVSVGASNYVQTALNNRISTLDLLSVSNGSQATFTGVLGAGQYLAPFIVVDGTLDDALAGNAAVYFPFLGSNSDGADHVRLLSNNVFGFEDLAGGGDNDFQDLIIQIQAA